MMRLVGSLLLVSVVAIQGVALQSASLQPARISLQTVALAGRWQVKFTIAGVQKNLVFNAKAKGSGSFLLLDTGLDNKPVPGLQPAAWSELTNERVSFSGEAELPLGTCCREIGTLLFKGKFSSNDSLSGKVVFVTSVDEDESPYKLKSMIGTFTATRIAK